MQTHVQTLFPFCRIASGAGGAIFAEKPLEIPAMRPVPPTLYAELAARLLDRIGEQNYFNGSVEVESQDAVYQLVTTLIIYRNSERIVDLVPVWWELRCMESHGEVDTDFGWDEVRKYLI